MKITVSVYGNEIVIDNKRYIRVSEADTLEYNGQNYVYAGRACPDNIRDGEGDCWERTSDDRYRCGEGDARTYDFIRDNYGIESEY